MMLPDEVRSPLTGEASKLTKRIPAAFLVKAYSDRFGYDAAPCFKDAPEVGIYVCPSGFRFYWPLTTSGPAALYEALARHDWNYQETKWEHDVALQWLKAGDAVLDVGCGQAAFLARAKALGATVAGLEFNPTAAQVGRDRGVDVTTETIAQHARRRPGSYDVVTSFQVLEHVTDPKTFMSDLIAAAKPGGRIVIGVPNSDGFVGMDDDAVLNAPPHHMGLWGRESLERFGRLLGLTVERAEIEPVTVNAGWFQAVVEREFVPRGWKGKLFYKLGGSEAVKRAIERLAPSIAGHTLIVVFRKT